jgi:hypothetical protein
MARPVARQSRAAAAGLPQWIKPQLTQLVDQAPDGPEWLHEIKFDGYRIHARLDRGAVLLLTRTGLDWTHKYPAIAAAVSSIGARQAYLDGELCGVRPDGITSFSMIQAASDSGNAAALVFFLFWPPSASRCLLAEKGKRHGGERGAFALIRAARVGGTTFRRRGNCSIGANNARPARRVPRRRSPPAFLER